MEVENLTPIIASAPISIASFIIRLKASSLAWVVILVYVFISPPTIVLSPARMSRPTWRARIVLPFAIPRIFVTFFLGISSPVVVINSFIDFFLF